MNDLCCAENAIAPCLADPLICSGTKALGFVEHNVAVAELLLLFSHSGAVGGKRQLEMAAVV